MGQKLEVGWQETAPALRKLYRKGRNSERRTRLHALFDICRRNWKMLLYSGDQKKVEEAAAGAYHAAGCGGVYLGSRGG